LEVLLLWVLSRVLSWVLPVRPEVGFVDMFACVVGELFCCEGYVASGGFQWFVAMDWEEDVVGRERVWFVEEKSEEEE
jgi:hypothetical protein